MRLPNRRPCMSVNAVTTVSMAPPSASLLRSSRESMPAVPPGPPGRGALTEPSLDSRATRTHATLDVTRDHVLLERAHGPLVALLRRHQVPDTEDEREHDGERR